MMRMPRQQTDTDLTGFAPGFRSARDEAVISDARSSIEWLRRIAKGDRNEGDPVSEFVDIGTDRATWLTAGPDLAGEAVDAVRAFCRDACPVRLRCRGERCNLYRIEHAALEGMNGEAEADYDDDE